MGIVEFSDLPGAAQGAEIEDRDPGSVPLEGGRELAVRDVDGDELEALVLVDERAETAADQVFEAGERDCDRGATYHRLSVWRPPGANSAGILSASGTKRVRCSSPV
jgi:hypothetical protein